MEMKNPAYNVAVWLLNGWITDPPKAIKSRILNTIDHIDMIAAADMFTAEEYLFLSDLCETIRGRFENE